jgi:hypothetical protein
MTDKLNRAELVELVKRIIDGAYASDDEVAEWLSRIEDSVPHPGVSDLIFYSEDEPDAEAVVDAALAYRPVE